MHSMQPNSCKNTQFKRQCKDHAYKTAEIILLCHKVLCLGGGIPIDGFPSTPSSLCKKQQHKYVVYIGYYLRARVLFSTLFRQIQDDSADIHDAISCQCKMERWKDKSDQSLAVSTSLTGSSQITQRRVSHELVSQVPAITLCPGAGDCTWTQSPDALGPDIGQLR